MISSWSKILRQGADIANFQAYRIFENADCHTIFCFTISFVCCSCCTSTVVDRLQTVTQARIQDFEMGGEFL